MTDDLESHVPKMVQIWARHGRNGSHEYRPEIAGHALRTLAGIGTPEVADFLVDRLLYGDAYERDCIAPFFRAFPDLVRPRLQPYACDPRVIAILAATIR